MSGRWPQQKWWPGDAAEQLDVLRRAVAELIGADPETWPAHGNAPLAIASAVALGQSALVGETGTDLIAAERRRQVEEEGWTPKHDDEHDDGEMARAAACYALYAGNPDGRSAALDDMWPETWGDHWYKPSPNPIRDLEKAGALVAAEIDRLLRLTTRERGEEAEVAGDG